MSQNEVTAGDLMSFMVATQTIQRYSSAFIIVFCLLCVFSLLWSSRCFVTFDLWLDVMLSYWLTVVSRSPKSQHVGICGLLHVISWLFRDIISTLTVVGYSLSLVRWRSTLCQMICETPLTAQQLSDNCWKHTFSLPISMFSALGVSHVMCCINLQYLLTYLTKHRTVWSLVDWLSCVYCSISRSLDQL